MPAQGPMRTCTLTHVTALVVHVLGRFCLEHVCETASLHVLQGSTCAEPVNEIAGRGLLLGRALSLAPCLP
jgi:hypothetical protein